MTKMDVDTKGGSAISISYITSKPILYVGTGQARDDLQSFDGDINPVETPPFTIQ